MTSSWESTNVPNMYFAGVLMHMRDYRKTMSGFIHGFRYNIQALYNCLNKKNHNIEWPSESVPNDPEVLAQKVLKQLTFSSSIFLQPGFMVDLIIFNSTEELSYIKSIPLEYISDSEFSSLDSYCTISLEYGDFSNISDPFNIPRDPDPEKADLVEYLHPIIRFYSKGKLTKERHILEDLENDYLREVFHKTAFDIFQQAFEEAKEAEQAVDVAV